MTQLEFNVRVEIAAGETNRLNVVGEGDEKEALGALIGRKGERLSALQHLVNLLLSKRVGEWTRILVDVEDYRAGANASCEIWPIAPRSASSRPGRCSSWSPCRLSSVAGSISRCAITIASALNLSARNPTDA